MCVLHHPASTHEAKSRAQQLHTQLEPHLTPRQIEAVQAQIKAKSFEALIAELPTADLKEIQELPAELL